jgi:hypothetical protein
MFYVTVNGGFVLSPDAGIGIWDTHFHHIAGTYDGSKVRLYVDGVQVGNGTNATGPIKYGTTSENGDLYIGRVFSGAGGNFNGAIDELSLYNRALSQGEIQSIFNAGSLGKCNAPTPNTIQFSAANYNANEATTFVNVTVARSGDTSGPATVDYTTSDGTALQRTDYSIRSGTLSFAAGETTKTVPILINDDNYIEGDESLTVTLSNAAGAQTLGSPATATVTIIDNDITNPPTSNVIDEAQNFVRQHYHDFMAREPDAQGLSYWTQQVTQCGNNPACIGTKRIDVSNAFFFEQEFQKTGAYVFRVYRVAFGNNQPIANSDSSDPDHAKLPGYAAFAPDRARVIGGTNLAQGQQDYANVFVQRAAFLAKYPASLDGPGFVDAILGTIQGDLGVDLISQRVALIALFNSGGRGAVVYRLADDSASNPITNGALIDAEYNRAFVATQYFDYLRRDSDMGGFTFWLNQINSASLRNVAKQHAMVCSFITSVEYQNRFSSVVSQVCLA